MEDRKEFIKAELLAGKSQDEIRRGLISHGHSTDSFAEELAAVEQETGTQAPVTAVPAPGKGVLPESPTTAPVAAPTPGIIGVGELLSQGFALTKQNVRLIVEYTLLVIALLAVPVVLIAISTGVLFGNLLGGGTGYFLLALSGFAYLMLIILLVLSIAAFAYAVLKHESNVRYHQALKWAFKHPLPIIGVGVLADFVTAGGYLFLLIPGIALAIYNMFSMFVYIEEDKRYLSALLRSTDLIYGVWWGVFGRMLAVGLLIGLAAAASIAVVAIPAALVGNPALWGLFAIVAGVVVAFTATWMTFTQVLLFKSLQTRKPAATYNNEAYKTWRIIFIILAVIGGLLTVADAMTSDEPSGIEGMNWEQMDGASEEDMAAFEAALEQMMAEQAAMDEDATAPTDFQLGQ